MNIKLCKNSKEYEIRFIFILTKHGFRELFAKELYFENLLGKETTGNPEQDALIFVKKRQDIFSTI